MHAEPHPYLFLAVFLLVALLFPAVPLVLAWLWSRLAAPPKPSPEKNASYECGLASPGVGALQFKSEYYLYGLLFLIFDAEVVFLLPFAVGFLELPLGASVAMLIFVLLLAEGLAWAWMKGILNWT